MTSCFRYSFVFAVFVLTGVIANSQTFVEIFSRNNENDAYHSILDKQVRDSAQLHQVLNNQIVESLSEGFVSAGYDSIIADSVKVKAYFTYGSRFKWETVRFDLPQEFKNRSKNFVKRKGVLDIENHINTLTNTLKYAADLGYPFAEIVADSLTVFEDSIISVRYILKTGERFYFDSVHIKTDTKIRQGYIENYIDIKPNQIFNLKTVDEIDVKLKNLSFIEQSRPFELAFGENSADVLLYLKKKKSNSFNGMIGILPNNKTTGKLLVTGDVNLYLLNSAGAGELFSFRWQKFEALSQNLKTEFSVPYLFKSQFGVGAKFDIDKKDSTYVNTDFTGRLIYGNKIAKRTEFFFRRKTSYVIGSDTSINDSGFACFSSNLFGFSYRYSKTDNTFNPRKGILLYVNSSFGTKQTSQTDDVPMMFQNLSNLSVSYYIPFFSYMSIKIRSLTSMIYSEKIFDNELDLIGGLNTIRGFDELSIPSSSSSIFSTELRYLFEEQSAFFVFYDFAYAEKRFTTDNVHNILMGAGAGLDLSTNAGIFSLVFAVGKQNENPFLFNSTKIHFGYRSNF